MKFISFGVLPDKRSELETDVMAEVILGVVSNGVAVASSALQLIEVTQKLHDFWDVFKDVDSNVERIKDHLSLISIIASNIVEICKGEPGVICEEAVVKSLEVCRKRTEKMWSQILELDQSMDGAVKASTSKRNWLKFRHTLQEKSNRKVESQLKGDVMMLLLALQPFFHNIHQYKLDSLTTTVLELSTERRGQEQNRHIVDHPTSSALRSSTQSRMAKNWTSELSKPNNRNTTVKIDTCVAIEMVTSTLGLSLPLWCRSVLIRYLIGLTYNSSCHDIFLGGEDDFLRNIKRRLKFISPIISIQIQTSRLPRSLTYFPILPCQSQIFNLCVEGNVEAVKTMFTRSKISPFVVNMHGENLLHAATRYAHADLCIFLLDIGVDGSAYDDRLLTPLDHLARKVPPANNYPSRAVNTIRALVERGRCQPLLPVTSNAISFYKGPEEGFAWLFASQYAGVNLEEQDSEGWTLLGDAVFNFGWWTQFEDHGPAMSWQTLYLIKAGADPHGVSSESWLTPLDAFLRGCTASQEDHAKKWLEALADCGIDLHEYARKEQKIHGHQQYLLVSWDASLWKWVSTKRRVVYQFGEASQDVEIWLEDFDALSWFHCGRYDLEIFQVASPIQSLLRWKELDARGAEYLECSKEDDGAVEIQTSKKLMYLKSRNAVLQAQWFRILVASLLLHYVFHLILLHS